MKKLLMALAAALLTVAAVSAESPKIYVDGGVTVPVFAGMDMPTNCESASITSVGTDVSIRAMFTDMLGIYANAGLFWPLETKSEIKDPDTHDTYTINRDTSDWDSFWGFNTFIGLAIMPHHGEKIGYTITPGLYYSTWKAENYGNDYTANYIGGGVNFGFDIYLTEKFYLKPDVEAALIFNTDAGDKDVKCWLSCKPAFSVGWRF